MPYAMGEYYERVSDYDLEYQSQSELDLPFWRELVQRFAPEHILELACGSGRIGLDLLKMPGEQTFTMDGLDIEPDMLKAYCRRVEALEPAIQQRVSLHEGDMTDFHLPRKGQFDLIFLPFNSIAHLYELEQQFGAFRCVYDHLASGGTFVVDTFLPDIDYLSNALNRPSTVYLEDEIASEDFTMLMYTTRKFDPIEQLQHITWTHEKFFENGDNERYLTRLDMHVFFPRELQILFLSAGLQIDAIYGSYDWKPLGKGTRQIVIGRKK
ncbi:class I SAM-dependent methyltransferase [Tengunoibacter tsumagoiensis]|uniref:Type 12 methyltransferase n=1 Tax=Tengunoibacter tsumagoiensis TaxID=2014871 RepID=A0A401ZVS2_9CHLR|nr:class I SAM-dependent methyltransferase [Tengunoibacter tsumagoiensis]GCE11001.1 type 12 methyltransferase [Tengunoibacter tsumagoiensis]